MPSQYCFKLKIEVGFDSAGNIRPTVDVQLTSPLHFANEGSRSAWLVFAGHLEHELMYQMRSALISVSDTGEGRGRQRGPH